MARPPSARTRYVLSQPYDQPAAAVAKAATRLGMATTAHYVQRVRREHPKRHETTTKAAPKTAARAKAAPETTKSAKQTKTKSTTKKTKGAVRRPQTKRATAAPALPANRPDHLTRTLRAAAIAVIVEDGARVARAVLDEAIAAVKRS